MDWILIQMCLVRTQRLLSLNDSVEDGTAEHSPAEGNGEVSWLFKYGAFSVPESAISQAPALQTARDIFSSNIDRLCCR